jgi:pyroglutamyl-peptidase
MGPKLLITGFGPFPGAPTNPTAALVEGLAAASATEFGASALQAAVLPTDFRRAWPALRRLYQDFQPDVVVHFGLSARATAVMVERQAHRRVDPRKPDAAGHVVKCGYARRPGPDALPVTVPPAAILAALRRAGLPAEISDDAGDYVCNFILYRSLHAARESGRAVGFIHLPPEGRASLSGKRLRDAAAIVLRVAAEEWRRVDRRRAPAAALFPPAILAPRD